MSLDTQLADCRRYAARQGWVLGEEYTDVMSGRKDDRPAYQRLLAGVRRRTSDGQAVVVLVAALDRLGRRLLERVRCREELKSLGVSVHSCREGGEVSDLVANILASVAQEESRRIGERVAAARAHARRNGWLPLASIPLGYRSRPATEDERRRGAPISVIEPDPERAPAVQEMFERVARGESARTVARWLAAQPSDLRRGGAYSFQAVRNLLANRVYIGQLPDGSRGNWEPLVDPTTWERVRANIADHRRLPRQATGRYLLTGLLRCPRCGGRMAGGRSGGHGPSYNCGSHELGGATMLANCRYSAMAEGLDALVLNEAGALLDALNDADPDLRATLAWAWEALSRPAENADALAQSHERAAERARERVKRLALLYADGEIDREGYELGRAQAQADLEAAEDALARYAPAERPTPLPPLDEVLRQAGGWHATLLTGGRAEQREVLGALIERVIPERIKLGRYRVVVEWSTTGEYLRRLREAAAQRAVA